MNRLGNQTQWHKLRTLLEEKKTAVQDEILHYPPPIPACDQQFNYLLEQRALLAQAVRQVAETNLIEGVSVQAFAEGLGCLSEGEVEWLMLNN